MDGAGKKAWGYYPAGKVWVPIQVDANGKLIANMSSIKLDDLSDVSVAAPTDGYFLYWDADTSLWKCRALVDADIPDTIARDAEVVTVLGIHTAISSAHHVRYADAEAVAAMGAKADANPLNHDRYTDAQAKAQAEAAKLDDHAAPDDNTDLNASISKHGLVVKATAPAANTLNVVGIANGEAAYTNKTLFDTNDPAALGTAAPGTSLSAAHRDHVHTDPVPTHAALTTGVHAFDKSCRCGPLNVTVPASTAYIVPFSSEVWDTDNIHDNVTNNTRLTCKTAGKYMITADMSWADNVIGTRIGQILLNGATGIGNSILYVDAEGRSRGTMATEYIMAVNDYVELLVYQSSFGDLVLGASLMMARMA